MLLRSEIGSQESQWVTVWLLKPSKGAKTCQNAPLSTINPTPGKELGPHRQAKAVEHIATFRGLKKFAKKYHLQRQPGR
jgi:hypothetical protein